MYKMSLIIKMNIHNIILNYKMKSIKELKDINILLNKRVKFKSDCQLFPIDLVGKVLSITDSKNKEKLIKVRVIPNNKIIDIGTNMSNL